MKYEYTQGEKTFLHRVPRAEQVLVLYRYA